MAPGPGRGALKELTPKVRPAQRSAEQKERDRARRRIARLEAELAKTRLALEITERHTRSWRSCPDRGLRDQAEAVIDGALVDLEPLVATKVAWPPVGRSRATLSRRRRGPKAGLPAPRPAPPNALSEEERASGPRRVPLARACDLAVDQVSAMVLDDRRYLCSISTMYRILHEVGEAGNGAGGALTGRRRKPS